MSALPYLPNDKVVCVDATPPPERGAAWRKAGIRLKVGVVYSVVGLEVDHVIGALMVKLVGQPALLCSSRFVPIAEYRRQHQKSS